MQLYVAQSDSSKPDTPESTPNEQSWPDLGTRERWADLLTRQHGFDPFHSLALRRAFRMASDPNVGYFESQGNASKALNCDRKTVNRAFQRFLKLGLFREIRPPYGGGRSKAYVPNFPVDVYLPGTAAVPTGDTIEKDRGDSSSSDDCLKIVAPLTDEQRVENPSQGVRKNQGFSEEEGATTEAKPPVWKNPPGVDAKIKETQNWIEANVSPVPMDGECASLLRHCWPVWKFPEHPHGWKGSIDTAIKTVTATIDTRRQFREHLLQHLVKAGLPLGTGQGVIRTNPVKCDGCGTMTLTPIGPLMSNRGVLISDSCGDCRAMVTV